MSFPILLVLAFSPGVFWLWYFARKNVYRPGPRRLLVLTFFAGMLVTIPVSIIEGLFLDESILSDEATIASVAVAMLLVVGPTEELSKFLAVRFTAYRSLYFDEPSDGLVYAAAASLGFASLENLVYVLTFGPEVIILRAPLSTLAHVIFGSVWGYMLGSQTQREKGGFWLVAGGLALAAGIHAAFNVALFTIPLVALLIVIAGASWTIRRFHWAQRVSPFRYRRNLPRVRCVSCSRHIQVTSRYCRFCGSPVMRGYSPLFCSNCNAGNRMDASYCTRCGDQLIA